MEKVVRGEDNTVIYRKTGINIARKLELAKCPNCGREVAKPERALRNKFFNIEAYTCDCCGARFKVTS